jgi:hypothetical protein
MMNTFKNENRAAPVANARPRLDNSVTSRGGESISTHNKDMLRTEDNEAEETKTGVFNRISDIFNNIVAFYKDDKLAFAVVAACTVGVGIATAGLGLTAAAGASSVVLFSNAITIQLLALLVILQRR